jgi:hypothetical protein
MYASTRIAAALANRLAQATGRTFGEVVDELAAEVELSIPAEHEQQPPDK